MRIKNVIVLAVLCSLVLGVFGYEYSWAKSEKEISSVKVGVISIRGVFENSKRNAQWQDEMERHRKQIVGELEKQSAVIKAVRADMETRKPDSVDYLNLMREMMEKAGSLEAKEKFHQQDLAMKEQRWTEKLYLDMAKAVAKVAKSQGLDIVLAKDENQFPAATANELMMIIKTSKIMYSRDELDITDEVVKVLDNK
ncbi:MAG: OmpH family outer membrane protein [Planctomycetes bacterium]|nr:OmpH family outer membrane protein [Planctomycetota bacterium]